MEFLDERTRVVQACWEEHGCGDTVLDREGLRRQGMDITGDLSSAADVLPNTQGSSTVSEPQEPSVPVDDVEMVDSLSAESYPSAPQRRILMPENIAALAENIPRSSTLDRIPLASAGRYATTWAECLEGSMAGDKK